MCNVMASPRTGNVSAGMAVLGLLAQHPDSVAGVALRLDQEHPAARWPRNIVHNTLPSLAEQGYVRVIRPGPERSLDRYEATREGLEHFRRWLSESCADLPALRDALRAKLRYVEGEEELRTVIGDIREQEELCVREGEAAVARYRSAHRLGRLAPSGEQVWKTRVRRALLVDEVKLWYERARSLQRLREHLEDPHGDMDSLDA